MQGSSERLRRLLACAMFAALTGVCSQIVIPLPMVPINLALFAVNLAAVLLGPYYGMLSMAVYILIGIAGVPVFAGFMGGAAALFTKTGGYIAGYVLAAFVTGVLSRGTKGSARLCAAMAAGTLACYALGTCWFMYVTGMSAAVSLGYCVLPFLPGDAVKILLAAFVALRLKKALPQFAKA